MRITIRPSLEPDVELDVTQQLIAAVAAELWKRYGGPDEVNWLEAERALEALVQPARSLPTYSKPSPRRRSLARSARRARRVAA